MSYKYKTNKRWYHKGLILIKLGPEDLIPEGFEPGKGPSNKPAWNKGLTKDKDPRVANISKNMMGKNKNNVPWNKGKTKENDPILLIVSIKTSKARKEKYYPCPNKGKKRSKETNEKQSKSMMGKPAWCKGLTKENNKSLALRSLNMMGNKIIADKSPEEKKIIALKIYDTMRKNNSFNISKEEKLLEEDLKLKYRKENVLSQYNQDFRYPFKCDFYIKSLDLFIEYQGAYEHGPHPFNPKDEKDLSLVEEWKEKALLKGSKSRYWNFIYIWTKRDPLKLKYLRDNKLNFMLIYPNNITITE